MEEERELGRFQSGKRRVRHITEGKEGLIETFGPARLCGGCGTDQEYLALRQAK